MRKPDLFTKIVLSVIALCLVVIALSLIFESESTHAQSRFSPKNAQVTYTSGGFLLYNTTTGDVWMYDFSGRTPDFIGRLTQPGKALQGR